MPTLSVTLNLGERNMAGCISHQELKALMESGESYALFDVREKGEYDARQIFTATSLPRREIEFRLPRLVPVPKIPVIVYDEGGERATLAAATMERMGYEKISLLEGGIPAWSGAGYSTVSGVNVPSKAFGERVHVERKVPEITPEELHALQEKQEESLILDVRTPQEYCRFCVPGAVNVPGGDLILWAEALRQKPARTVVVNCAGRTRSIIGTATLRRLGLTNVYALKNGTMGWTLAGLELETGPTRNAQRPSAESSEQAGLAAERITTEESIPLISVSQLLTLRKEADRHILYQIDVRSEGEYAAGHIPGSMNIPGGQAVQRADDYIAVRNGQIVFISHRQSRAVMTAYWYRQMGFRNVAVLGGGIMGWVENGRASAVGAPEEEPQALRAARNDVRLIQPAELDRQLKSGRPIILDVGSSFRYEAAHVPGARWLSRGWLEPKIRTTFPNREQSIVLTCPNGRNSVLAASTLGGLGYTEVSVLDGGVQAWSAGGYPTQKGLEGSIVEPNDVVIAASLSEDKEAMKRYLQWEVELSKTLKK
ncbi:MAG: rhodanese-like domain-containing protein [Candidatus Binatia bacterium]